MSPILSLCDGYRLDLSRYARTGLRVGIWASSGRGKSFGVGVLCEELLANGIPVIALDPEGELHTLRERFRVLVLGGARADLPLPSGERAAALALARVLEEGLGLVIDLSDQPTNRAQQEAALPFLERLWVLLSERRAPAALVVEEVHIFAPQSGASLTSDILHRFAKQGRKRGVLLAVASQRTQAVSKELMSQLNFPAIGGFEIERDYDAVKALVEGHTFEEFRALPAGEFFLPAAGRFERWRARLTAHGGDAPSWTDGAGSAPPPADSRLSALVDELRDALAQEIAHLAAPDPSAALRAEIRRLKQQLEQAEEARRTAEAEAGRLRVALQVAGVVKVVIQNEVAAQASHGPPRALARCPPARRPERPRRGGRATAHAGAARPIPARARAAAGRRVHEGRREAGSAVAPGSRHAGRGDARSARRQAHGERREDPRAPAIPPVGGARRPGREAARPRRGADRGGARRARRLAQPGRDPARRARARRARPRRLRVNPKQPPRAERGGRAPRAPARLTAQARPRARPAAPRSTPARFSSSSNASPERRSPAQETGPDRRFRRASALLCAEHRKRRDGPVSEAGDRRSSSSPG
ncbi:uncharacterized protein SOCE26_082060 [Sorangium cellulosum]|uniref:Helicase HerA central domain-containing protein n=1 Tax=Sorangium cellulosum TaxID=56 RepID=A0A2L0F592_SORCE|nr:DUF87 domain-containing protein [Sorangium cellulosum]AUX46697.1 uncharacterized protein SOCE26_082060 [Sorangium cellulosum]